jgi:ornithine cyclodeaminase
MTFRVLTGDDLRTVLTPAACIEAMDEILRRLARGHLFQPLRVITQPPRASGLIALMPSYRAEPVPRFALKALTVMPDNPSRGLDTHMGVVLLSNGETGAIEALVDASVLTEIRTAAASAVATRALARADARTLVVLGAGAQARAHVETIPLVRDVERIVVWSRRREAAEALVRALPAELRGRVEVAGDLRRAVEEADVLVTATAAREPIVEGAWLEHGVHVNAVGACFPDTRELDGVAIARARLFTDRRESAVSESGDYLLALREGAIGEDHAITELGDVLIGSVTGRTSDEEITLFDSLGLAVEDLAAAEAALAAAEERGIGTVVEL